MNCPEDPSPYDRNQEIENYLRGVFPTVLIGIVPGTEEAWEAGGDPAEVADAVCKAAEAALTAAENGLKDSEYLWVIQALEQLVYGRPEHLEDEADAALARERLRSARD